MHNYGYGKNDAVLSSLSIFIYVINFLYLHYNDVMLSVIESQITRLTIVYSTVYSGADQRNVLKLAFSHESSSPMINKEQTKCHYIILYNDMIFLSKKLFSVMLSQFLHLLKCLH